MQLVMGAGCLALMGFVGLYFAYGREVWEKLTHWSILFVGALFLWVLMIAGTPYNLINNPPPYQRGQDGRTQYFHGSAQAQFQYEGYMMGALSASVSVFSIVGFMIVPQMKNLSEDAKGALSVAAAVLAYGSFTTLKGMYQVKNPGYPAF